MPKISSHSVDKAIGGRLKLYRQRAGISQTAMGKQLGVSFQQVQKYENGANRISAATLIRIAKFLGVSVGDLMVLEGSQAPAAQTGAANDMSRFTRTAEGRALVQGFLAIKDSGLRRQLLGLVKALGRNG